jgi:pimeloyl-ACP methyl ester carboxylesterase
MRHSLTRSPQLLRSWYMLAFQLPRLPEAALRRAGAERAVKGLVANGLDAETAARYAARLGDPARITGPLNWYRAIPWSLRQPLPTIAVPTLYVWGDGDHYITRQAALATARFVTGPYRFEALAGASHWLPSGAADRVGPLLLEHLAATPAEP